MKRIYLAAAAVLALGMTANAAIPSLSGVPETFEVASLSDQAMKSFDAQSLGIKKVKATRNGVKKAAPDPSVMYGTYEVRMFKPFKGDEYKNFNFGTVTISEGSKSGYVTLTGIFAGYKIECPIVYDYEDNSGNPMLAFRLTNGQALGEVNFSDIGKQHLSLETAQWNDSGEGSYPIEYVDIIYSPSEMTISCDYNTIKDESTWRTFSHGLIQFNSNQICLAKIDSGDGYWPGPNMGYAMAYIPIDEYMETGIGAFKYDASEWEDAGSATVSSCGWLNAAFEEPIPSYTLDVKVKKGMPSQALLVNPFQIDYLSKAFEFTDGYIYLDLSDPEFPIVRPIVNSGLYLNSFMGYMYCSNMGGNMVYIEGSSIDEAKAMFNILGYEMPTIDDSNILTLPNTMFGLSAACNEYTTWEAEDGSAADMTAVIELPAKVQASVKGIEVDEADVNAPARYFNLQGVEISAPAKGEVVIVKKGGKAVKTVF